MGTNRVGVVLRQIEFQQVCQHQTQWDEIYNFTVCLLSGGEVAAKRFERAARTECNNGDALRHRKILHGSFNLANNSEMLKLAT